MSQPQPQSQQQPQPQRLFRSDAWQQALQQAWQDARSAYQQQDYQQCLRQLELVHILGQQQFWPHLHSHWWMLKAGWRLKDWREVRGQWLRLLLTPLGHLSGRLPLGNNGRARVHPLQPQPLPADIQALIQRSAAGSEA